jgi:hypothetical protein
MLRSLPLEKELVRNLPVEAGRCKSGFIQGRTGDEWKGGKTKE